MATEATAGSHKWNETAAWSPAEIPTVGTEVVFGASSGTVTIPEGYTAFCKSLKTELAFKGKLINENGASKLICSGSFLWGSGIAEFEKGVLELIAEGSFQPPLNELKAVTVRGGEAVKLEDTLKAGGLLTGNTIFETLGNELVLKNFTQFLTSGQTTLKLSTSTIRVSGTFILETTSKLVFEAEEATFIIGEELSTTNTTLKFGTVEMLPPHGVAGYILGGSEFKKLILNNSSNAKEFAFTEAKTYKCEEFSVINGTETCVIKAEKNKSAFQLSKAAGTVKVEKVKLEYSAAEGGATWEARNSINAGHNTGWNFEFTHVLSPALTFAYSLAKRVVVTQRLASLEFEFHNFIHRLVKAARTAIFTPTYSLVNRSVNAARQATFEPKGKVGRATTIVRKAILNAVAFVSREHLERFRPLEATMTVGGVVKGLRIQILTAKLQFSTVRKHVITVQRKAALETAEKLRLITVAQRTASLRFSKAISRAIEAQRKATLTPTVRLQRVMPKPLTAALKFGGVAQRATRHKLQVVFTPTTKLSTTIAVRVLKAILTPAGKLKKPFFVFRIKQLLAELSPTAKILKQPEPIFEERNDYVYVPPARPPSRIVVNTTTSPPLAVENELQPYTRLQYMSIIAKREKKSIS